MSGFPNVSLCLASGCLSWLLSVHLSPSQASDVRRALVPLHSQAIYFRAMYLALSPIRCFSSLGFVSHTLDSVRCACLAPLIFHLSSHLSFHAAALDWQISTCLPLFFLFDLFVSPFAAALGWRISTFLPLAFPPLFLLVSLLFGFSALEGFPPVSHFSNYLYPYLRRPWMWFSLLSRNCLTSPG